MGTIFRLDEIQWPGYNKFSPFCKSFKTGYKVIIVFNSEEWNKTEYQIGKKNETFLSGWLGTLAYIK